MFAFLRKPHADLASVILRLGLGFLFLAHGYIKLFQPLSWSDRLSPFMQGVVGWTEVTCGVLLVLGLLTRLAALALSIEMVGAIVMVTGKRDFIDPSFGPHGLTFSASGFEYNVVLIVACLALMLLGSGWFAVDHLIFGRKKAARPAVVVPNPPSQPVQESLAPAMTARQGNNAAL